MDQEDGLLIKHGYVSDIEDLMNLVVQMRTLICEEGYTEVTFRNPEIGETRTVLFLVR